MSDGDAASPKKRGPKPKYVNRDALRVPIEHDLKNRLIEFARNERRDVPEVVASAILLYLDASQVN